MVKNIYIKPVKKLSKIEIQKSIEHTYNKKQLKKFLREWCAEAFTKEFEELETMDKASIEYSDTKKALNLTLDLLGILVTQYKSIYLKTLLQILAEKEDIRLSAMSVINNIQVLKTKDLIDLELDSRNRLKVKSKVKLSEDKQKIIDRFKYLPPMIVEPLEVNHNNNNRGVGYLTTGSDSLILGGIHHNHYICPDILNKFNKVNLCINTSTLLVIQNSWKSLQKEPKKETQEQFEMFQQGLAEISALMIVHGNSFYLPHRYDKRGRIYCSGYHISYQSNSYAKAIIEFNNKQVISDKKHFF